MLKSKKRIQRYCQGKAVTEQSVESWDGQYVCVGGASGESMIPLKGRVGRVGWSSGLVTGRQSCLFPQEFASLLIGYTFSGWPGMLVEDFNYAEA